MTNLYPFFMTGHTEINIPAGDNTVEDSTYTPSFNHRFENNGTFSSPILQHQSMRRRYVPGMRKPIEYNQNRNTLTMSSIYNTIDRTRMRYFGDHQD